MILTNRRISPIRAGIYKAKIVDIRTYDNVATKNGIAQKLVYSFAVFTDDGIIEIKTNVFISDYSGSDFAKFKKSVLRLFDTDTIETDEHIGLTVKAKFTIKTTANGDEYPQLAWYAPYTEELNNDENSGGNNNE